jgi:hypothetical protein
VSAAYDGRQFVGIDLHRRRSVITRMDQQGEVLEAVRISNDPRFLAEVLTRAGEQPEVVLEATYGWYWAADVLAAVDDQGIHRVVDQGIRHPALVSSSLLGLLVSRWSGGCRAACGVGSSCLP